MRKMFTTLKSVVAATVIAAMALAASCSYDDSGINQRVDRVEKDLAALTERVAALEKKLADEVDALSKLINGQVVVTKVETAEDGSTTVTLSDGKSFVVYPECTVVDTDTDTDTYLSVKADEGVLYWAIFEKGEFKEWLLNDGKKVPVYDGNDNTLDDDKCDGGIVDTDTDTFVAPYFDEESKAFYYAVLDSEGFVAWYLVDGEKVAVYDGNDDTQDDNVCDNPANIAFRVENGNLEFTLDGGNTWTETGLSAADAGAKVIESVVDNGNYVTFTLPGGASFNALKAELIECEATRAQLFVAPGETRSISFTINDAVADINIMNQPLGWKASIEVAPAADDDVDPGMGILAAGGANFLLNITGPVADFVNAGYAEKEGYVSVHFNSANGGCKIAKVAVNLAELKLSVDASGNISLSNSVAESKGVDEMGEPMYDFADFHIGIVDADDYATYGDRVFAETFDDWTYEYNANVASTMRTTGFQNVVDLQWYEAGVCEMESYSFTVDQLAGMFWPKYQFELGKEYIIFVTTESEMVSYVEQPILTNAVKASYKRVSVTANLDKENTTWNDATVELNLAGYNYYVVGWTPVADLQELVDYKMAADIDSALSAMIGAYGVMSAGAIIGDINATVKLSELAAISMTQWAPMLNADTEYVFFVYPFNAQTEMEVYQHQFVEENLFNYGTFKTKALVEGEFEAGAKFELVTCDENNVAVNATFGENVSVVAYNWSEVPFLEPNKAAEFILADEFYTEYVTFSEDVTKVEAFKNYYYGLPETLYLCVLAINENGEYVYVEYEIVKPIVYTEFVYTQADFAEGVLTLKGETNKDAISIVVNPGLDTLVAGDYVAATEDWTTGVCQVQWSAADAKEIFANATSFDFTGNPNSYPYYVSADFQMNVAVEGDVYTIVATDKKTGAGPVKFMYTGTFGIQEEETAGVVFTSATAALAEGQPNWHDITFANGTDTVVIRIATSGSTECLYGLYAQRDYGQARCINGYPDTSTWNGVSLWPVTMNVVDNGDGTLSVTIEATEYGGNGDSHVGTFTGVIEGLTFVHPEVAPEFTIPGDGETYDLDARLDTLVAPWDSTGEAKFTNDLGYSSLIKFNPGLTSIEAGDYVAVNQQFSSSTALEFDAYNCCIWLPSGATFYPDNFDQPATLNVQKNEDWYCITMIGQGGYQCPFSGKWRVVYIGKLVK